MIPGVLALLAANAAVGAAALGAVQRSRSEHAHLNVLTFLLVRLLLISLVVIAAGLTSALHALGITVLAAVPLIALRPAPPLNAGRLRRPSGGIEWMLVVILSVIAARLVLQAWWFAPYSADALSYHLPKIGEWITAGRFTRELGIDTHAAFPAGFELIETWWVVFLHHDVFIELAGVEFLLLAFSATWSLAKYLALDDRWTAFAATAFILTPGLHLQATAALNDLPVTALFLTAAALIVHRRSPALVLVAIGLGVGIKGTFLFMLPGLAVLWWMQPEAAQSRTPLVTALAIAALLAGGFWYARNALWYGNPIHPMGGGGVVESSGYVTIRYGLSIEGAAENFSSLVENRIGDREAAYSALSRRVSGWGALPFACGLPALVIMLGRDWRFRKLAGAFAVSLVTVLLLVQHDDWFARFVLFFAVIPVLATAMLAASDRLVLAIAIPALLLQFISTMVPEELTAARLQQLAAQPWRERTLATTFDARMTEYGSAIGYYADNVGEAYWGYGPGFSRRVIYLRDTEPLALVESLKRGGARAFYAVPGTEARATVLAEAVNDGLIRREQRQIYVLADR